MWQVNENGYYANREGKLKHRVIYESKYGPIPEGWVVHHIDQIKISNSVENLVALPEKFHTKMHVKMREAGVTYPREYIEKLLEIYLSVPVKNKVLKVSKFELKRVRRLGRMVKLGVKNHEQLNNEMNSAFERDQI